MAGLAVPLLSTPLPQGRIGVPKAPSNPGKGVDPRALPRVTFEQLHYAGAFRLPAAESNGDSFSFGGYPIAYNPDNNSLFVGAHSGRIAEVNIPDATTGGNIESLPSAGYLQPLADPTEGHIKDIAESGASLAGLLVHDHRLLGTGIIFYDAVNAQSLSHFARPLALNEVAVKKLVRVGQSGKTGFVAGYMAAVPSEWQSALGGSVVTGQCCISIITRTSWGPSAFVFDAADVNAGKNTDADPLLYYNGEHPTLGPWEGANATYGATTEIRGLSLIAGTRSALFFGRNGMGTFCYGDGTADQSRHNTRGAGGETYCYDPASADKGQHAYPYRYQMWAYDLGELAEVRAGHRDPWSVKPYAVWPFELPFPEPGMHIGGVAYDAARQRLFIAQMQADRDGFAFRPLIHVFTIQ
ncbi:MAG TPA: hypothetical protein VM096_07815 [Vicinamibacterales bacterium]|nr:hypothetical protein [Vicinamibacterales bacterium]